MLPGPIIRSLVSADPELGRIDAYDVRRPACLNQAGQASIPSRAFAGDRAADTMCVVKTNWPLILGVIAASMLAAGCTGSGGDVSSANGTVAPSTSSMSLATSTTVSTTAPAVSTSEPPAGTTTSEVTTTPPTSRPQATTTTSALATSPLNGLSVADESLLDRRVMAVKIDNHRAARPQSGIQDADVVFELLVEAGITRFIALFHAADSTYVGPIRSVRSTDPTLLLPLGATLQTASGDRRVLSHVDDLGLDLISITRATTFRIDARRAPHNLYGDTFAMRDYADSHDYPDDPPPSMFIFGEPSAPTGPANRVTLSWSGGNVINWEYNGTRYLRFQGSTPHDWVDRSGNGGQVAFDTLVVLFVDRESSVSNPSFETLGSGRAFLFYGGAVVEGTWSRPDIDHVFTLTTDDGDEMTFPPGSIWISVFPADRPLSWE